MIGLNLLVLFWLIITSGGVFYGRRLVRRAEASLMWLQINKLNGYREIAARGAIRRGYLRVAISVDMVLMGLIAGGNQFLDPDSGWRTVSTSVFRLLFIAMAIMFTYKSYMEDHELDLMINESQRVRVHEQNDATAILLDIERIDAQDKNTAEIQKNTEATEANTKQRYDEAGNV